MFLGGSFRQFSSVNPGAIPSMKVTEVGDVLGSLAKDANNAESLSGPIEEYFRKSFRKLSYEDAKYVVSQLGDGDG